LVWWLRLGLGIERIKPGHPEQNGRHERMHLTLKREATKPADDYVRSPRPYRGIGELEYPFLDWTAIVTTCGRICCEKARGQSLYGVCWPEVGVSQVGEHIWLVSFMDYDLVDDKTCRLEPIENPYWRKVLPMSPPE
jgi:putative transposase